MKYYFDQISGLEQGIALLCEDLSVELVNRESADFWVTVKKEETDCVRVTLKGREATLTYGGGTARFFRGLAILARWVNLGETDREVSETPLFRTNGAMVDMSRNAVMTVDAVKDMLRAMALMGLNMYMLYTEDTYEITEYPYFGYMRGRYTKEEIRELDAYAAALGIELIPCIQMMGHLATHLHWDAAAPYRDTANVMLAGAEATYTLIDHMLKTVSECFTTRRIHIGMDETHDLGRGKYLDQNGYRDPKEIYLEHLERVLQMVRSYGLEPMMWSDMFFRFAGKDIEGYDDYDARVVITDEVKRPVPEGVGQVYWDYYHKSEEYYGDNIEKHYDLFGKEDTLFAGGIWTWSGHCPLYSRSLERTLPALDACRDKGVKELIATVWGNGGEANMIVSLAGLAWYADFDYKGTFDLDSVKECFARATGGVSYDDMMKLELPAHPDGGMLGLTPALLYNDPLVGLVDRHIDGLDMAAYYADTVKTLESVGNMGIFAPAYHTVLMLAKALEKKGDFGVRLKAAYDRGDSETLRAMAEECDEIIARVRALRDCHYTSWMAYHKPFGWEIHDIRYGGVLLRLETAKKRILAYLDGELDRIEELEEPRLRLDGQLAENAEPRFHGLFNWMGYTKFATASRF